MAITRASLWRLAVKTCYSHQSHISLTWRVHAHFRDCLSSVGWDLLCSTHVLNMKCLRLPATKKWQETPTVKNFRFDPPFGGLRGNGQGSSISRWKARCQLSISDNCNFASSHGFGTIKRNLSKSAFSEGVGHFERKFLVDGDVARNGLLGRGMM